MPTLDVTQIFLFANVDTRKLITSDGVPLGGDRLPRFFREEIVILCITFVDNDLNAVALAQSNTYEFGIAQDYDEDTNVLALAENDNINIADDWDDADATAGKLSVRLNTNTEEFATYLGTSSGKADTKCYLRRFGDSTASILFDYACEVRNIARPSDAVPEGVSEPTYRTAAAQDVIDATKADLEGSDDIEITDATKGIIFATADGTRRRMTVDNYGRLLVSDDLG